MGMIDLLLKYGARDDQNQALSVASQAKDNLVMSKLLALKAHQDQESVVNKSAIAEMHLGKSLKGRSSASSLTYNSMCPSTPVMINWHQTGSLTTIKEQWLIDSAVRINPKLRLSPKYQPMALHAVTRLDLSNNEIVVVPSTVFNMQSLKFLSLAGNKLEALPDCAYNCLWLEEIQLQDNRLDCIPPNLFKLPKLSILDLANNKLQFVPYAIWSCLSLRELNLSLNMLSDLPTCLHMSRHESVSSLSGEGHMFDAASINSDMSSDNQSIQSENDLDNEIDGDAKQMEEKVSQLDQTAINHCNKWKSNITIVDKEQLDPSIHKDDCKLHTLILSHNMFREVPACLSCLAPHLSRLHLCYNSLTSVGPLSRYPPTIKYLDLSHNQITSWPSELDPDSLCYGSRDEKSILGSLCSTPEPRKVSRTNHRQNSKIFCPHRRHFKLENLRTILLGDNLLREITFHISHLDNTSSISEESSDAPTDAAVNLKSKLMFANLSMLDVSNNNIKTVPPNISELTNLSVLNISGNENITDLPPQMGLLTRLWNLNTG